LTVGDIVQKSAAYLRDKGADSPRLDAELLLAHVLGTDRLKLYLNWDRQLSESEIGEMRALLARRGQEREPVSRIIGQREFYGRPFRVGKAAFVPRPETEGLVDRAVEFLRNWTPPMHSPGEPPPKKEPPPEEKPPVASDTPEEISQDTASETDEEKPSLPKEPRRPAARMAPTAPDAPRVIDIGTGSGCIAISIALEQPRAEVYATDVSEDALRVARDNASAFGAAGRVRFHRGDLFAGLDGPFQIVVSNPPYVASSEVEGLDPEVAAHDPRSALDGGASGVEVYRLLIEEAPGRMAPGALLVLEIGEDQGAAVADLLRQSGKFEDVKVSKDLAGRERYVQAVREAE
jgi:release factor glutamine methyltransferase